MKDQRSAVRLGAVDYLNVRPLVYGLENEPRVTVRYDVPSVCARLLMEGQIDLGMVPSIAYADRPDDRIVPNMCIGSDGPVASVALFTRVPLDRVRAIAIDSSSRTSALLTRILCERRFGIMPAFLTHEPDLHRMLRVAEAALLIGDHALFVDAAEHDAEKIDLGAVWTEMTGLPFVWAFWAGPTSPESASIAPLLQEAAERGMSQTDTIAQEYCRDTPELVPIARAYLRENLMFRLNERAIEGLTRFYDEAVDLGLIPQRPALRFF